MKSNIILATFGTILGLLGVYLAQLVLVPSRDGTEFASINDFRAALNDERASGKYRRPDGSLPFAAIIEPHPSDDVIYTLKPGLNDNFTGVNVRTNSFGMRSPERPLEKAPGVYRIALMGDSFAFGWGVREEEGFAHVIERELNEKIKGERRFEVLNFGIPGYSTFQEVALFQERAMRFSPDAVLVFLVDNDFEFPFFIKDPGKPSGLVQSFSLARIGRPDDKRLRAQKELMKGKGPVPSLRKLSAFAREQSIPVYVVVNPRRDWRAISKRLARLRSDPGLQFLDIGDQFERYVDQHKLSNEELNLPNDPHPTALRHRIYGELIAQHLLAPLTER